MDNCTGWFTFYVIYALLIVQIRTTLSFIDMLITRGRLENQHHFLECFFGGVKHQPGDCGASPDVSMLSRVTLIKRMHAEAYQFTIVLFPCLHRVRQHRYRVYMHLSCPVTVRVRHQFIYWSVT